MTMIVSLRTPRAVGALARLALLLALAVLGAGSGQAQTPFFGPALNGPILGTTSMDHSRILLYDTVSGTRRDLRFGTGEHLLWDFSPDGCEILFTLSDEARPARIYRARLDGSDVRSVVTYDPIPPEGWSVWEPDWSPDGSRIAFTMTRETRYLEQTGLQAINDRYEYRVAWVPAEGGTPTFYSVAGDEHTPVWSPDGAWLAYVGYEKRVPGADISSTAVPTPSPAPGQAPVETPLLREADLWVISADGETKYRLTYFPTGSVAAPRWSPDGQLIGFTYAPVGNNDTFWMIANQPGSIPTQLSFQWSLILDLTWTPDSTAIIGVARDFQGQPENRLWRIPLVGNADTDATLYLDDPALSYVDFPRFSADGRFLAVRSEYALALIDTEAGTWTFLDPETLSNAPPVWSPGGFEGEDACREL